MNLLGLSGGCDGNRPYHERGAGFEALQAAVREGLDSGPSGRTVPSIMKEVEARLGSDGRLAGMSRTVPKTG